jgi:hypothetical protein
MDVSLDDVDADVVRKLWRHNYIGGKHTEVRSLVRGFDKGHADAVEKSIKKLIRLNIIIAKKSTGQLHVSLNPRRIGEIRRIIGE